MNAYRDPEMDDLGDEQGWDPQVRELAHYLRASSRAYAHIEPSVRFRQDLRRRLMREAWELAASAVSRSWDEQHKVLTLTPRNGLSANTQYTVTVTSASTAQSQPVSKIKPVVFSTLPTPAPTPSTGPRPTQPPSQILNPRSITQ